MTSNLRSSLDIDPEFAQFISNMRKKLQNKNAINSSTPSSKHRNKRCDDIPLVAAFSTPKITLTVAQTTPSPRTPIMNKTCQPSLSNYGLNSINGARASSPQNMTTNLIVNESPILLRLTPSPRTPRGIIMPESLACYRLRRLRHHLDAHRRPNFS